MESVYSSFAHYEKPNNDFERARQQISTPFDYYDVDLSVARNNEVLPIAGDFLYIDLISTGEATIELNNQHDAPKAPFKVIKGFALNATFKQLKFSNVPQSGLMMRIMFSTGDRVIPATSQTQISGDVTTIESGYSYSASYKSDTALAANTPDTVFTGAANVNGAVVFDARFTLYKINNLWTTLIAKSTPPTSNKDGDVLLVADNYYTGNFVNESAKLNKPVLIPAGKGLFFISGAAESAAFKSVLYKFL